MKQHPKTSLVSLYTITAILLVIIFTMESCASRCKQQRRYWSNHRAV